MNNRFVLYFSIYGTILINCYLLLIAPSLSDIKWIIQLEIFLALLFAPIGYVWYKEEKAKTLPSCNIRIPLEGGNGINLSFTRTDLVTCTCVAHIDTLTDIKTFFERGHYKLSSTEPLSVELIDNSKS